jgi:hypothetical protein
MLGDCYFLAALACLAEYPDRIKKLFIDTEFNQQGIYGAYTYVNGCKNEVFVDDHVPCIGSGGFWKPKFA